MDINIQQAIVQCAPSVPVNLMRSLVNRESNFKQFAIGMDARQGYVEQPKNLKDAIETINQLKKEGRTFSIGLGQIHISNIEKYNLSWEQAFDPCVNLHTSQLILWHFYNQALKKGYTGSGALFSMLRGYNSGNVEGAVSNGYASAILKNANLTDYSLAQEAYKDISVKVTLNDFKQTNTEFKEEARDSQYDFFSNKSNVSEDFFKRNSTN